MRLLVTAGNTQTPIDRVRCITNIFSGRTGANIAAAAHDRGHAVTVLTSHPETVTAPGVTVRPYRTFDELAALMAETIPGGRFDAVVHAAAVSDYHLAGVFTQSDGAFVDAAAGKVRSTHPELWLKLVPAPKLVDRIRPDWRFAGVLVKFKLEVGVTDEELLGIAERSRVASGADLMSANTLDGMHDWAFVGAGDAYRRVPRPELAGTLVAEIERLHAARV